MFILFNLFTPSFNRLHQEADICGEIFLQSFFHLTLNVFLIFHVHIPCSQRSRKKMCDGTCILGGQRLQTTAMLMSFTMSYWFNIILIYKFRLVLNPRIISFITGKVVLTITWLEWLVRMHIIFDKNTGVKSSSIKWLFSSNFILSLLKALQGLGYMRFTPGLQLQR